MASTADATAEEPLPPPPPPCEEEEEEEIDGTRVFGEGAAALSALTSWAASASKLPPLRSLDLRFSDEVDGRALASLGAHARGLTRLRLDGCRNVVTSLVTSSSSSSSSSSSLRRAAAENEDESDGGDETETRHSAPQLAAVVARASKSLRSLSLYWIPRLPTDVVYATAAACKGLTSLNLSGCTRAVDDGSLLALASSLGGGGGSERGGENSGGGGLRRLDLTRCQLLTDPGMAAAFALMPRLRELRLYAVENFADEAARALCAAADASGADPGADNSGSGEAGGVGGTGRGRSASGLEVLDVCGARDLSDAAAAELVTKRCGGSLRVLGCGWVPNVGDALAVAVGRSCRGSLESLSLHGNRNLSEAGFDALVAGLSSGEGRRIKALDVRGCVGVREGRRSREALRGALGPQLVEFALQR